ncbi:MAG TPA: hypothetical protein DCP71_00570 [Verrucomicrobiales bacterium]|nr:hypothetical protein [Verrucomicrobiales bacterium]
MSICVTESLQSQRMLDALDSYQERVRKLEADMAFDFTRAIEAGDPDATPAWAGTVTDYERARALGIHYSDKNVPQRAYTVAECLQDALDYAKGPSLTEVVKVLSLAMKGTDPTVALAARQLVERAAAKWASQNAEIDE